VDGRSNGGAAAVNDCQITTGRDLGLPRAHAREDSLSSDLVQPCGFPRTRDVIWQSPDHDCRESTRARPNGLTRDALAARIPARDPRWLTEVLADEVSRGRIRLASGLYSIRPDQFPPAVFAALAALDLDGLPA